MNKQAVKKSLIAVAFVIAMIFALCSGCFVKDIWVKADIMAKKSSNIHQHSYMVGSSPAGDCAAPVRSYLFANGDGLTRVEAVNGSIVVEQYQKEDFSLISAITIPMELSRFGGFYEGENYNYFVFGQENPKEQDTCEVFRIVQYTKDWMRIASDSVYGANTSQIFEGGSLQMCESGNVLYIRTCHEMYTTSDGLNHQTNMTFCYNSSTHRITDKSNVDVNANGYVSHSFNQFIKTDGKDLLTVDQGDGTPRAIVLMKYEDAAGRETFDKRPDSVQLLSYPGEIGQNYTGTAVGGLEVSSTNYLTAYNTVDPDLFYGCVRNIFVSAVSKSAFSSASLQTTQYTSFEATGEKSASNPILVKLTEEEFMLMWEIYDARTVDVVGENSGTHTIQYVKIDGEGKALGEVHTAEGDLSDCQPLVLNNEILWYVTAGTTPVFYTLNTVTEKLISTSHNEESSVTTPAPTNPPVKTTLQPDATSGPATNTKTQRVATNSNMPKYTTNVASAQGTATVPKVKGIVVKNARGKKIKSSWNKVSNVAFYSVQIARNRSFTKENKSIKVIGTKYTQYSLKKKKTYYVRVRAWRHQGGRYVAGKWSSVKKVKIKK